MPSNAPTTAVLFMNAEIRQAKADRRRVASPTRPLSRSSDRWSSSGERSSASETSSSRIRGGRRGVGSSPAVPAGWRGRAGGSPRPGREQHRRADAAVGQQRQQQRDRGEDEVGGRHRRARAQSSPLATKWGCPAPACRSAAAPRQGLHAAAGGGGQHRMAGGDVPFHGAAEARMNRPRPPRPGTA